MRELWVLISEPRMLLILGAVALAGVIWLIDRGIAQAEKDLDGY